MKRNEGVAFSASEAVTFQVSVLSNLIARPYYATIGRHTGLSINDWRLMIVIADKPGMSQAEIVHATGFNKATVSRLLRNLDRYVVLEPHPKDSRKHSVYLKAEGWEIYNRSTASLAWRQDLLTQALPPEELDQFRRTLAKLIDSARTWSDTPDDLA